jgi:hypothetical protein
MNSINKQNEWREIIREPYFPDLIPPELAQELFGGGPPEEEMDLVCFLAPDGRWFCAWEERCEGHRNMTQWLEDKRAEGDFRNVKEMEEDWEEFRDEHYPIPHCVEISREKALELCFRLNMPGEFLPELDRLVTH